jgi:hypothetical protein
MLSTVDKHSTLDYTTGTTLSPKARQSSLNVGRFAVLVYTPGNNKHLWRKLLTFV